MSRKNELPENPNHDYVKLDYDDARDIVGKLLTYIDATFTDKEQREAQKQLVKRTVYDWFGRLYSEQFQGKYNTDGLEIIHSTPLPHEPAITVGDIPIGCTYTGKLK